MLARTGDEKKATARVSTLPCRHPRLYYDYDGQGRAFIVEAGEEGMMGGDPCGRLSVPQVIQPIGIYCHGSATRTHPERKEKDCNKHTVRMNKWKTNLSEFR
jgi:hypothetical protein